jgi:uncharacterized OB-fold protein
MTGTREFSLVLDYRHGLGSLEPYFTALSEGRALASCCPECGRCWLPPRPRCPEDGAPTVARELDGTGTVRAETETTSRLPFTDEAVEARFVLVALDGATGLTFGRMRDPAEEIGPGARVRLAGGGADAPHPAQALHFNGIADKDPA